jgi:EAL domain-containing protein (putative c-di-GMP-specific phosphodiesterase class I)
MSSSPNLLHSLPGSESELRFFARFWEWEGTVRANLPRVLHERSVSTVFQTIFHLDRGHATPCGYEALARFPVAPAIPVGLWFRIAHEMGVGSHLEQVAAAAAVDSSGRVVTADRFLNINTSLASAVNLVCALAPGLDTTLVVDVPYPSLQEKSCAYLFEHLRSLGAQISLDDTPLDQLHSLREAIRRVRPQYLKVDVLSGLYDNAMGRFNLAEAATWCRDTGISLIAERVEKPEDLELLHSLGVEMAQGYSLARPA